MDTQQPNLHPWRDRLAYSHFMRHVDEDYLNHIDQASEADLLRFLVLQNFEQAEHLRKIRTYTFFVALPIMLTILMIILLWNIGIGGLLSS